MSDPSTPCPHAAALPDDYPGKTVVFPASVERLVYGIFGVQARAAGAGAERIASLAALFGEPHGPPALERLRGIDATGAACTLFLAHWSAPEDYARWRDCLAVRRWWRDLPLSGDVGCWREVMTVPKARYQYGAGVPQAGGIGVLGELAPCAKFGYWGGYRDRVPASAHDDFAPAVAAMPAPVEHATLGRRVSVTAPNNLCYIREGQGWEACGEDERRVWRERMLDHVDDWVRILDDDAPATGCLALRDCGEFTPADGTPLERRSQLAFLLSLAHIEHAARTNPHHLALKQAFTDMYTEPRFTPRMHVWVEMLIVKQGELDNEYVHCHPRTGLLPWCPSSAVST